MKQEFGLIKRPWGVYYLKNKTTGEQTSLKTRNRAEAERLLQAHNETKSQPQFNLALARVYINGADPKLGTRTWQEVMEHIVVKKTDETRRRWGVAILDKNFDCIRNLPVAETRPEHFDQALADGKVSTNVFLRRLHNFALGVGWLPAPALPPKQWPKVQHKPKRAIALAEHEKIITREQNPERKAFYQLLWELGGAQGDVAKLCAEDIDWRRKSLSYFRAKTGRASRICFDEAVAAILRGLPSTGPLFPYLRGVRASDRATEFKQRCQGLGIQGVTLHSYRYSWAERAREAGYPERAAQEVLGHGSKAVHRAYARNANPELVTIGAWQRRQEAKNVIPLEFKKPANGEFADLRERKLVPKSALMELSAGPATLTFMLEPLN